MNIAQFPFVVNLLQKKFTELLNKTKLDKKYTITG